MSDDLQQEPRILGRSEHSISRTNIDDSALKVLYRLHNSGFKAYMCGGGVRDLMLGRRPKDFDICTDASPGQIRRVFRNSRVIGRRFRLAHVYFKDQIVEVATFRRDPDAEAGDDGDLLITDDNVFGTPREDAFRRDFTVNALFYSIADYSVIDYVGGVDDLRRGVIRTIGEPDVRFREDPVRMLRACEMAGRLDFTIDPESQEAIGRHRHEVLKAAPARLTEEVLQLLRCGKAGPTMQWMLELGILEVLLPEAQAMLTAGERGLGELQRVLPVLDTIVASGREISDAALLGTFLLPQVLLRRREVESTRRKALSHAALRRIVHDSCDAFFSRFTVARAKVDEVVEALLAFHRLGETDWNGAERARFSRRGAFHDALVLLESLTEATGEGRELLAHWKGLASPRAAGDKRGAKTRRGRGRGRRGGTRRRSRSGGGKR